MRKALIIGMARSGVASARLLYLNGWRVVINDARAIVPGVKDELKDIEYIDELGADPLTLLDGVDLMVLSPGVNPFQPFVEAAREKGIEIIGEIELGYRYSKGDFLCITGTNGKTTCTALLGEICKLSGRRTHVLGNIGLPLAQEAMNTRDGDFVVVETAALQLEGNNTFHAKAAAVCNITEDHLDRFGTMEYYTACKAKIFDNQTEADFAVLNYDDPITRALHTRTKARVLYFSRRAEVEEGIFLRSGQIIWRFSGEERVLCQAPDVRIPGLHNLENAMLCAAMALSQGIPDAVVVEGLKTFRGVEHRIEFVREFEGVRYINDSKGTNPDSTIQAIRAMDRPTVLILGGYDKHSTFDTLFAEMKKSGRVKAAVLLGETADKLMQYAREADFENAHVVRGHFEKAVALARTLAQPGDAVLLSPACASWDMFENFEERGRAFKEIVNGF